MGDTEESTEELIEFVLKTEDYFEVLGVTRKADVKEVTKAYRKRALRLHPDKCQTSGAEDAFKKVAQAFACLKDEDSRVHYERFGVERNNKNGMATYQNVDPNELFRQFFETMQQQQQNGSAGHFNFSSGSGATFVSINGRDISAMLPSWMRPVFSIVPGQVWFLLFMMLFMSVFSRVASVILSNWVLFLFIAMFVKPPFRGFLLSVTFSLGLFGLLPKMY